MTEKSDEVDEAIAALKGTFPNESGRLASLKMRLVELRSTEEDMSNLDRNHKLGYIKDEEYLHRYDQLNLRRNVLLEEVREEGTNPLVDALEDKKEKSRLRKLADSIVSYKDVLQALAEIAAAAGRKLATG